MLPFTKKNQKFSDDMQDALLKDPRVQQSLAQAGEAALNDPEVQRQITAACQEKFPEYAAAAGAQVKDWAKDPKVQAKAKEYGAAAVKWLGTAGDQMLKKIEQGPAGVRFLSFMASVASASLSVMSLLNVFSAIQHMVLYMVSVYQLLFSMTTMLFEMNPDWIVQIEEKTRLPVSSYQDVLLENAKFLSLTGGRGMFYVFQGTLWLAFASLTSLLELAVGLFLIFIGTLHVMMHFGIAPKDVAMKMREGYERVRSTPSGGAPGSSR